MQKGQNKFKFICILVLTFFFIVIPVNTAWAHAPHDVVTEVALSPTYQKDQNLFILVRENLLKSEDGGASWKRVIKGIDNKFELSSLDISSNLGTTLFLSTKGDGIYKSEDKGNSWSKVNNGLKDLNINLLSISAHSDALVLAAGTEKGLYQTKDGGKNWQRVLEDKKITAIAYFPSHEDYIIIGDEGGQLYLSTNKGDDWKKIFKISNSGAITALGVSPNYEIDKTWFIGTQKGGMYKTSDEGSSFVKINEGISDKSIVSLVLSPKYQSDLTLFASTWNEGVIYSNDGGKTWKKYSQGLTKDAQADQEIKLPNFMKLEISQSFAEDRTLFLGGFNGLFKSINGGLKWKELNTLSPRIIVGLALSPNYEHDSTAAITTYLAGAYITHNQGETWKPINRGLEEARIGQGIARLFDLAFSPNYQQDQTIFSASNNHLLKSTDSGKHWQKIPLSNNYWGLKRVINAIVYRLPNSPFQSFLASAVGMKKYFPTMLAISPTFASDQTLYLGTRGGDIFSSTDGGETLKLVAHLKQVITALIISPDFQSDQTLYSIINPDGGELYKTIDGGKTWQLINQNNGLTEAVTNLAISPNYRRDKTLFAGTVKGVFKSNDGGKNWLKLTQNSVLKEGYIEAIAISPNFTHDQTVLVSIQGKGLFKTVDGGEGFVQVGTDLTDNNYPLANMYAFHPASYPIKYSPSYSTDNTIYASSGIEVFKSNDGGNTWEMLELPSYQEKSPLTFLYYLVVSIPILRFIAAVIATFLTYRLLERISSLKQLLLRNYWLKIGTSAAAFVIVLKLLSV